VSWQAPVRAMAVVVAAAALVVAVRDDSNSGAAGVARTAAEPAIELPSTRGANGEELAAALAANDEALRAAIDAWRNEEDPPSAEPPPEVMDAARYLNKTVRKLAKKQTLARSTVRELPSGMAAQIRSLIAAQRDLFKLSAGWPPHKVETGDPEPLRNLSGYYDEANQRYGIHQHYLAAIHFVESKFGRVKNDSVAGAQGPMQFIPSTWEIYGEGGNIQDDHDAILAAARLLKANGAPGDYARALRAYNNSPLYVDAVTRYAKQIQRDRHAVYFFYCFGP
jgi:membrane-bound lytic murein transglycosylase B